MNHYLKKSCAMLLAAVMMAASGPQFVSIASNRKNNINMEETRRDEVFGSMAKEIGLDADSVRYSDDLSVDLWLNHFKATGHRIKLQLDKQKSGKIELTDEQIQVEIFSFTPPSTGYYQIEVHTETEVSQFDMQIDDGAARKNVNKDYIYGKNKDIAYYVLLSKNKEYGINLYAFNQDIPKNVPYTIKITKVKENQIDENKQISSSFQTNVVPYSFKAKKTGIYRLLVSSENGDVKLGSIYNEETRAINENGYNSENCYFKCIEGKQYYFYIAYKSGSGDYWPDYEVKYSFQIDRAKSSNSFDYIVEDDKASIMSYSGTDSTVTIPESIDGIPVNRIGEYAFAGCDGISKVIIPKNIEYIAPYAFFNCSLLSSVTIPKNVRSIGDGAFMNCISLQTITVPKSVKEMGPRVFSECENLTTAVIDGEIQELSVYSFYNCTKLKNVKLPHTLVSIEGGSFQGCKKLLEIVIPDGVTKIMDSSFNDCINLKNITLSQKLNTIGSRAFSNCTNLEKIKFPSTLETIWDSAFENCSKLKVITLPEKVSMIGYNAFANCSKLQKLTLPSALTGLGNHAFAYCTAIESVTLPKKLNIDIDWMDSQKPFDISEYNPFAFCSKLKAVSVHKDNKMLKSDNGMVYVKSPYKKDSYVLVICPAGKTGAVSVNKNTEWILQGAFEGCSRVTEISIPSQTDLTMLHSFFDRFTGLKTITIDSKNKTAKIEKNVVYSKDGKTVYCCPKMITGKIKIKEGVTNLAGGFRNCSKLTEVAIPASVNELPDDTFTGCESLVSIKVDSKNKTYKSINGSVCSKDGVELCVVPPGIEGEYKIPEGIRKVEFALSKCNKITKISIPASVDTCSLHMGIPGGDHLESYSVDSNNKFFSSKSGVLYDKNQKELICCPKNIKNFTIPATVTKIGAYAFTGGRHGITKLVLPQKVNFFGFKAFFGCKFDIYFECEDIPGGEQAFDVLTTGRGFYDASNEKWSSVIADTPNLFGLFWKKMDSKATSSIKLNKSSTSLTIGENCTLKATVSNSSGKLVTWSTSDKSVAIVSSKGVVTAKDVGTATITAKCDEKTAKCTVTVNLAQPKLKKAASAENGKVKVTWSKVSGATGYIVYKKSGKEWKKLATVKSPTVSYTDKKLTSGKKYTYTVAAYKKKDGKTYTSGYNQTGVSAKVK